MKKERTTEIKREIMSMQKSFIMTIDLREMLKAG